MTKADLIEKMAKDAKVSKVAAGAVLDSFMANVTKALKKKEGKVTLVGFGTFVKTRQKARKGRNPQTGEPIKINDKLYIQELDIQEEIQRYWGDIHKYLSSILYTTGLDEVLAEELAVLPGMEEISLLLYINKYVKEKEFDVILTICRIRAGVGDRALQGTVEEGIRQHQIRQVQNPVFRRNRA